MVKMSSRAATMWREPFRVAIRNPPFNPASHYILRGSAAYPTESRINYAKRRVHLMKTVIIDEIISLETKSGKIILLDVLIDGYPTAPCLIGSNLWRPIPGYHGF